MNEDHIQTRMKDPAITKIIDEEKVALHGNQLPNGIQTEKTPKELCNQLVQPKAYEAKNSVKMSPATESPSPNKIKENS